MELPINTIEILAFKVLNRNIDKTWIDWAVDMLMAGFDTESLVILAGESEPYNQFELQRLTDKVFNELNLNYSDKKQIVEDYNYYLIDGALNNKFDSFKVLGILKDICIELDYDKTLYNFYSLYFAKDDLMDSGFQWYWKGATIENIDNIITEYMVKWRSDYLNRKTTTA